MATASLLDYLAGDALTKLVQAFANKPGVPRPLPQAFYTPVNNPNVGVDISYDVSTASREGIAITNPDAPPHAVDGSQAVNKKVVAVGGRAKYVIGQSMIQALQQGGIMGMNAQMELERQLQDFTTRFTTLDTNLVHSALFRGKIDVGSTGLIQTSTSSPVRTLDFSGPAANTLTTDGSNSTYNIGTWSTASTKIVQAITQLKQYASKQYGFPLTDVYYGPNVPSHIAGNTEAQQYLKLNPQFNTGWVSTGQIPDGFLGLKWHPTGEAAIVLSGASTAWTGDNFLMFTPPPEDRSWYEFVQCGLCAPTGLTSESELREAMFSGGDLAAAFPVRYGIHSYSLMNATNIAAELIVANFKAPLIKSPNAVFRGVCA